MNIKFVKYYIGYLIKLEGFMMMLPFICSLIYKEEVGQVFLYLGLFLIVLGSLLTFNKLNEGNFFISESFVIVVFGWIFFSLFGALPFYLTGEITNFIDCIFETVSGFTTSGVTIINDVESVSKCVLFWRSFTHFVGGMGVLVFMLCILPTQSDNMLIMKAEATGMDVGRIVPHVKDTAIILYKIYIFLTIITIICFKLSGMSFFDSICIAFGTAGTGGFSLMNTSCATYSKLSQGLITFFMIVFGVNFNIYFMILLKQFNAVKKSEELRTYICIIFISVILITLNVVLSLQDDVLNTIHNAFFNVASVMTTAGFTANNYMRWPIFSRIILLILMIMGSCAGSTAGGFKISRVIVIVKEYIYELKHQIHPNTVSIIKLDGRAISRKTLNTVNIYFIAFVFIHLFGFILISLDGYDFETVFSAVATTFNNVGLGLGKIATENFNIFSYRSKILFIFLMLVGRLEIFPMMVMFTRRTYRREL